MRNIKSTVEQLQSEYTHYDYSVNRAPKDTKLFRIIKNHHTEISIFTKELEEELVEFSNFITDLVDTNIKFNDVELDEFKTFLLQEDLLTGAQIYDYLLDSLVKRENVLIILDMIVPEQIISWFNNGQTVEDVVTEYDNIDVDPSLSSNSVNDIIDTVIDKLQTFKEIGVVNNVEAFNKIVDLLKKGK